MTAPRTQAATATTTTLEPSVLDKIIAETEKLREELEPIRALLTESAPKWFDVKRVYAGLDAAIAKDPNILKADRKSLLIALNKVARWGLDIGDGVDLVVLNRKAGQNWIKTVEAWVDYKGMKALAIRQGLIRSAEEYVIYEDEEFEHIQGSRPELRHRPKRGGHNRQIVAAYSLIQLPRGITTFNLLYVEQIEATRAKSRSWSDAALADKKMEPGLRAWYAKKCAIRDYLNRQPKTGVLGEAMASANLEISDFPEDLGRPAVDGDGVLKQHDAKLAAASKPAEDDGDPF